MRELRRKSLGDNGLPRELVFSDVETDLQTVFLQFRRLYLNLCAFKCSQQILMQGFTDLLTTCAADLDHRVLRKHIGQGV